MVMVTKYTDVCVDDVEVDVEVSLSDFDLDDVLELLADDGYIAIKSDVDEDSFKKDLANLCHLYRAKDSRFMDEIGMFLSNLSGRILWVLLKLRMELDTLFLTKA